MPMSRSVWFPFPRLFAALALLLLAAAPVCAHVTKLSSAKLTVSADAVDGAIELNALDLAVAQGRVADAPQPGAAPPATAEDEVRARAYLLEHARVLHGGQPCPGEVLGATEKADHRVYSVRWTCPQLGGDLRYEATLFHAIDPASKHMVTVQGAVARFALLSVQHPTVDLGAATVDTPAMLRHYFEAGVEHILIGFDHIAFVVAAIAWGRRFWPLAKVVTAFTLAHSVTLALAVLEIVSIPSSIVEPLIALSIVYVAGENFLVRNLSHRGWLTFGFGLIHGFGFAGVLREFGLPKDAILPALAAFNLGVEAGQLLVVASALAVLLLIERRLLGVPPGGEADVRVVRVLSGAILLLGAGWTIQRVAGL